MFGLVYDQPLSYLFTDPAILAFMAGMSGVWDDAGVSLAVLPSLHPDDAGTSVLAAAAAMTGPWASVRAGLSAFLDACLEPAFRRIVVLEVAPESTEELEAELVTGADDIGRWRADVLLGTEHVVVSEGTEALRVP